ncbi:hypothetical protein NFI96_030702 [Prochilodus magdalenae]|nr:hypothetical protein NFI96_030702 [Prochilodus magdalenae]
MNIGTQSAGAGRSDVKPTLCDMNSVILPGHYSLTDDSTVEQARWEVGGNGVGLRLGQQMRTMSGKNKSKNNPDRTKVNPGQAKANSNMLDDDPDSITALRNAMEGISKQIQALQTDLKADLRAFKDDITIQVKREVSELRADIDQKFATVSTDIQQQSERINANQARTEEVEAWSAEANTVFLELLREQRRMIEKLDDLESRSRRNNLRIYGIPEDTEKGVQTIDFVKEWLSTELSIPTDLQIQRAHRALTAKPKPDKAPRSVIVNFLQYSTKELVLSKAWEKKNIKIGDSRIYFDHDYSAGVLQQRKDYAYVKAALKKQGIRFQTPYTKNATYTGPAERKPTTTRKRRRLSYVGEE